MGRFDDLAIELESDFLERGFDVLDEFFEGLLNGLVVGVSSGLDVKVGHRLAGCGIEFASVENEILQAGWALQHPVHQGPVERLNVVPLRGVEVYGNEIAGRATHGIGFQIEGLGGGDGLPWAL